MKKINILFITGEYSTSVGQRTDIYFMKELAKSVQLMPCYHTGDINDTIKNNGVTPDFILLNDIYLTPNTTGLSSINIPKGMIVHDNHNYVEERRKYIQENKIDYIFSIYRDSFCRTYPELKEKMYWHPHFVNPEIYKDYDLAKEIDYLLIGYIDPFYPLRSRMLDVMKEEPGFIYYGHPGYKRFDENEFKTILVDEKYAMEINRAKVFLTDDTKFHNPIMKYYEVLACKTLLLAPSSKELEDLGFIPGVHFVDVDENNFLDKARYFLKNEKERNQIVQRGYEMVHAKHTVYKRVEDFINIVKTIICK